MTYSQTIQTKGLHGLNDDRVGIRRDVTIRDNKGSWTAEFRILPHKSLFKSSENCAKGKRKSNTAKKSEEKV